MVLEKTELNERLLLTHEHLQYVGTLIHFEDYLDTDQERELKSYLKGKLRSLELTYPEVFI